MFLRPTWAMLVHDPGAVFRRVQNGSPEIQAAPLSLRRKAAERHDPGARCDSGDPNAVVGRRRDRVL
jgi:hypothetical protein